MVGGSTYLEGRVEVCFRDQWSTVCDDQWEEPDANVACGQLGHANQGRAMPVKFLFLQKKNNTVHSYHLKIIQSYPSDLFGGLINLLSSEY